MARKRSRRTSSRLSRKKSRRTSRRRRCKSKKCTFGKRKSGRKCCKKKPGPKRSRRKTSRFGFKSSNQATAEIPVAAAFVILNDQYMTHSCFKETNCNPTLERTPGDTPLILAGTQCGSKSVSGEIVSITMKHSQPIMYYLIPFRDMLKKEYEILVLLNGKKYKVKCYGSNRIKVRTDTEFGLSCSGLQMKDEMIKTQLKYQSGESKQKMVGYMKNTREPVVKLLCHGGLIKKHGTRHLKVGFGFNGGPKIKAVSKGKWVVYTKNGCPACANAKQLLTDKGVKYIEIDGPSNQMEVEQIMLEAKRPDYSYWPKIFNKDGDFIEGFSGLKEYYAKNEKN